MSPEMFIKAVQMLHIYHKKLIDGVDIENEICNNESTSVMEEQNEKLVQDI